MNIIFIGFKKSGKTTVGKSLSLLLKKKFVDIDELIKKLFKEKYNEQKSVFEIYEFLKENRFRELETLAFESIENIDNSVIATSGGCILNKRNLEMLKNPKIIIYLNTTKENLNIRIQQEEKSIFQNINFFEKEYEKRKIMYENVADLIIETNHLDPEKLSLQIKEKLNV